PLTQKNEPLITALYERLSRDDDQQGDSNSIVNQKSYLTSYAADHGFAHCQHYTDDGFSGGNFERPGWKQLIADIDAGLVGTVIAKDLSRVGRDYIQTGFYTEVYFRRKGVRFIAIGNGVDTVNPISSEFAPFMNVLNEMYLREQSKKMRTFFRQRGNSGKPTNTLCVYGYRKDPTDKNHWLVDDEAAAVVRRIYQLAIDCHGPYEIARILEADKVECPAYYNATHDTCMKRSNTDMSKPYAWNGVTIHNILTRREYMGHTVNFRSSKNGLKAKRQAKPSDEWLIFENTHEAIIPEDRWQLAQCVLAVRRRTDSTGESNPLTGKLYCAECGAKLNNHRSRAKQSGRESDDYYDCPTYSQSKGDCCCHYVTTAFIRSVLLQMIRSVSQYAVSDEAAFADQVRALSEVRHADAVKNMTAEAAKARKRIVELDTIIQKLYESYALGKTPESRFNLLSSTYEKEQAQLKDKLSKTEEALASYHADTANIDAFMQLARQYRDTEELTASIINSLIDRVVVHVPKKVNGQRHVQIDVIFRFIGCFTVPVAPTILTEEQLQEEAKRAKERKRNHQKYLRKKERNKKLPHDQAA
ncbi:MAG: recombinase family protein, partial [Clostridia bacterium]|nr:recombinase family protein [Clostridia bacterium]